MIKTMKLKYLLASGLFLSTAFVACTNDDFAEISAPAISTDGAIALGEGYSINVNKGIATRAEFTDKYAPVWVKGDQLGAAWVNMVTKLDEDDNTKVAEGGTEAFQHSDWFYSNHPFTLTEGEGTNSGTFTSPTNAYAGAYVLYYPYDETVAMTSGEIPVAIKSYETDCENSLKNISGNMFSYSPAAFVPGGPQTGSFNLKQIPVLVQLQFAASKELNMNLDGGVTISNIVIEAKDASGSVLAKTGKLTPVSTVISGLTADNYNGENNKNLDGIVEYNRNEVADNIFVTVLNSDDPKYQIVKKTVADQPNIEGITEGKFVFSMLPLSAKATSITIKVVTDKGVFATTYDPAAAGLTTDEKKKATEMLNLFNEGKKEGTADVTKGEGGAAYEGGQVAMGITLDVTENDKVIYTVEEFMNRWEAAMGQKNDEPLEIGTPLTLTEALVCSDVNTEVEITGAALTIPSLSLEHAASVEFNNDELIVEGDVYSSGDAPLTIKKLTAKNVEIEGKADIKAHNIEKLTVASDGNVTLAAYDGADAATAKEDKAVVTEIVINGNNTDKGLLSLTPDDLTITKMDGSKGTLAVTGALENKAGNTITLGNVTGTINNYGTVNLEGEYSGTFNNKAGAKLNVNADNSNKKMTLTNDAADTEGNPAGVVNIAAEKTLNAKKITNNGTINVSGNLTEGGAATLLQTNDNARINAMNEDAVITMYSSGTALAEGYVVILVDDNIANGSGEPVAFDMKSASATVPAKAATVFVNCVTNNNALSSILSKNLIFYQNINVNADITFSGNFTVAGNVTINNTTAKGTEVEVTLADAMTNTINKGASLTLGKNIKLKGSSNAVLTANGAFNKGDGSLDSSITLK